MPALLREVRGALRWRLRQPVVILMYHRVADVDWDPFQLCVSPARFREQMQWVRAHGPVRPLKDVVAAPGRGRRRRALVVTLDDGYADNLWHAVPVLRELGVPATVFVVAGRLGQVLWWDRLARCLGPSSRWRREGSIRLPHRDGEERLALADDAAARQAARRAGELLKPMSESRREAVLAELEAGADLPEDPTARVVTPDELLELARCPGVDLGAHTLTHPCLATLTPEQQLAEIQGSRRRLEEQVPAPVELFAYPYGEAADYDEHSRAAVREAGLRAAVTTRAGVMADATARDELPRFAVKDWSGARFGRRLYAFLGRSEQGDR